MVRGTEGEEGWERGLQTSGIDAVKFRHIVHLLLRDAFSRGLGGMTLGIDGERLLSDGLHDASGGIIIIAKLEN